MQVLFGLANFSLYANVFAFSTAKFHVVHRQWDIWKPYVALGGGALAGVKVWKRVTALYKDRVGLEKVWDTGALALAVLGWLFFLGDDTPAGTAPPQWHMYTGIAIMGLAQPIFYANNEIIYSKLLTHRRDAVGRSTGFFMALYNMANSLARFGGPFLGGYIMHVTNSQTDASTFEDCGRMVGALTDPANVGQLPKDLQAALLHVDRADPAKAILYGGEGAWATCPAEDAGGAAPTYAPIALFAKAPVCCFAPTYYCDAGCELKDSNPWLWACLATGVVCFAVNFYYTHVLCDYEETERLEKACELRRRYARGSPNQYLKDYETTGPDGDGNATEQKTAAVSSV